MNWCEFHSFHIPSVQQCFAKNFFFKLCKIQDYFMSSNITLATDMTAYKKSVWSKRGLQLYLRLVVVGIVVGIVVVVVGGGVGGGGVVVVVGGGVDAGDLVREESSGRCPR